MNADWVSIAPARVSAPRISLKSATSALRTAVAGLVAAVFLAACATGPSTERAPRDTRSGQVRIPDRSIFDEARRRGRVDPITLPHKAGLNDQLVRVGLLLPLSARSEAARNEAESMLKAAQLALFEQGHERLVIIPKDTSGTASGARQAAESAIQDGAAVILGPLFSEAVEGAASAAGPNGPPVIGFSNDRTATQSGAFIMGLAPEDEITRMVDYAARAGMYRFAALAPSSAYGTRVVEALRQTAAMTGGELRYWETYPAGGDSQQLSPAAQSLAQYGKQDAEYGGGFDAVILPEGGLRLLTVAPLLPYYDLSPREVKFMGTSLWRDDRVLREPTLDGGWFVGPDPQARDEFEMSYFEVYGDSPSRLASLAYDAVSITALLTRAQGAAGMTRAALQSRDGFYGADGLFRFNANGAAERGLAVFEITGGSYRVIEPAPFAFPPDFQNTQPGFGTGAAFRGASVGARGVSSPPRY